MTAADAFAEAGRRLDHACEAMVLARESLDRVSPTLGESIGELHQQAEDLVVVLRRIDKSLSGAGA